MIQVTVVVLNPCQFCPIFTVLVLFSSLASYSFLIEFKIILFTIKEMVQYTVEL